VTAKRVITLQWGRRQRACPEIIPRQLFNQGAMIKHVRHNELQLGDPPGVNIVVMAMQRSEGGRVRATAKPQTYKTGRRRLLKSQSEILRR